MTAGRVLGYIVATRDADGSVGVDYGGPLEPTAADAQPYADEPGDFVVAICAVDGP